MSRPAPAGAGNVRTFRIYRWDPDRGEKPRVDSYEVDMDRAVGSITSCIPLSNLESVKHKLVSTFQREKGEEG